MLTLSIYKLLYNCLICLPSLHYALYTVVSYQHCEPVLFLCQHQCTSTSPLHLFQMNPRCKARYYIAWVSCPCYVSHVGFFCSFSLPIFFQSVSSTTFPSVCLLCPIDFSPSVKLGVSWSLSQQIKKGLICLQSFECCHLTLDLTSHVLLWYCFYY